MITKNKLFNILILKAMKKRYFALVAAAFVVFAAPSCSKDMIERDYAPESEVLNDFDSAKNNEADSSNENSGSVSDNNGINSNVEVDGWKDGGSMDIVLS